MTIIQAEKKIRNAGSVGLFVLIILLISLASDLVEAIGRGGIANLQESTIRDIIAIALLLLFIFGISKKSRMAAIGMFTYFLAAVLLIGYFLVNHLMARAALSQDNLIVILIVTAIFIPILYFAFEGARGAVTYHRLRHSSSSADQPVALGED
jgi:4-amino-4-deoxy-L-arabinose transferase-like glycosyltransferase